jgi:SAM-dependent methyltransferase
MSSFSQQLRKPSGFWGKLVARIMNRRNKDTYTEIISELELKGNESLFEIGYGPGLGIKRITAGFPACRVSGIDFSDLMYETATKENRKAIGKGNVRLFQGDFLEMNSSEKFDRVYCSNVVYFWDSLAVPFAKVFDMLHPGGEFLIYMDSKEDIEKLKFLSDFSKYTVEEVESSLKQAGFTDVRHKLIKGYYIRARK